MAGAGGPALPQGWDQGEGPSRWPQKPLPLLPAVVGIGQVGAHSPDWEARSVACILYQ